MANPAVFNGNGAIGVVGNSQSKAGVVGSSQRGSGIQGFSQETTGIFGYSRNWWGIHGFSDAGVPGIGVFGESKNNVGVSGRGYNYGVMGEPTGVLGTGVLAKKGAGQWALDATGPSLFRGYVEVFGDHTVFNGNKRFKIDHPLDPQNRYLSHNAVEAPERKNVYDGVAQLDEDGTASVDLPNWFEALNEDFRYQLTAVGGAAPNLHVAEEIYENRFRIAGGEGGMKVGWQVTGTRKDAWAAANPFVVEQDKPHEDRGRYLEPSLYGAPEEQRVRRLGALEPPQAPQMPPQAPEMPPGFDFVSLQQQLHELRGQIEELKGAHVEDERQRQLDDLRRQIEELRRQR